MSFARLLLRNLFYHWRGNVAVLLGIILGSAVLTGALLVGDSLRGSLRALTLDQLGWVENAMLPGRFFRARLVDDVAADKKSSLLLLQGSATRTQDDRTQRAGKVTVLGVDASYWPPGHGGWDADERVVELNQALADALGAKVGDTITLHLERADAAPREALLGQRKAENIIERIRVDVRRVVPDKEQGNFSLRPSPVPPRNAFVPIKLLQRQLDLAGRANAILTSGSSTLKMLDLDDWGLRYRSPRDRAEAFVKILAPNETDGNLKKFRWQDRVPRELADKANAKGVLTKAAVIKFYEEESARDYWVLESQRMLLEPQVVKAVQRLAPGFLSDDGVREPAPWALRPILIYLADTITDGKNEVPYAIIAGDDAQYVKDGKRLPAIADDQIMLMQWPGSPLQVQAGDKLTVRYYAPDSANHLVKKSVDFKVHPLIEDLATVRGPRDDPDLTPEFRGITDKLDIDNWDNPPFPFDPRRIKKADKDFWKRYRTTPRAYVSLNKAQELWKSRFGDLTSIQVRQGTKSPEEFAEALLAELKPDQGGFVLQPIREQALRASAGATDFGVLFLSFSFFLIVAALLLVGLLVRLNLERRAGEMGLLLALGWSRGKVRRLLLCESAVLALAGSLLGLAVAMLYAQGMLKLLVAYWPDGASLSFLRLHTDEHSFIHGFAGSVLASVLTLWWASRSMTKLAPLALLRGETTSAPIAAAPRPRFASRLAGLTFLLAGAVIILGFRAESHEMLALVFFTSGTLFLISALAGIWANLQKLRSSSAPKPTLLTLGIRNAGRHAVRSLLTVGLLASASFLIVAVESFHKDTGHRFLERTGGSGGFAFYAESSIPVTEDLNQPKTRKEHGLDTPELRDLQFFPCRVQQGDDASCLNLYKPLKPRVMGVPQALIERGGFAFAKGPENPWQALLAKESNGAIPAIIDKNTADWILKVGVGDTIAVTDGHGEARKLRIVALLQESIFQSEVLISEAHFMELFAQQTGYSFYLIDVGESDSGKSKVVLDQLGKGLSEFGLDVQTTTSRLQGYLAVENTYLATFQALGGLGLILGAAGLAIVLLRGVWERRAELALMLALGFRNGQLAWLVLAENALLLALGLAAGTVSALLAVAPHLVGAGAQVLWLRIGGLLALVLAVGLVSASLAVWATLRTPVLTALRRE